MRSLALIGGFAGGAVPAMEKTEWNVPH